MDKKILIVLVLAFVLRLAGIAYGLPLWLIDDEPPFILGALKMMELKTLLPNSHFEEFKTVLYYPPYLSYLYLLPFSLLVGIKYLFFSGSTELFTSYLLADLSGFFIIARFFSIFAGVFSIYFTYATARNLFRNKKPAVFSAILASTSLIHISLSIVSRHWIWVFLFTSLVLFFLSQQNWSFKKKYFLAFLSAGIGIGFAVINVILTGLILSWYLLYEKNSTFKLIKEKYFYLLSAIFIFLASLPYLLYKGSLGFTADVTTKVSKNISGAIFSPFNFAYTIFQSEFILIIFAAFGFYFVFRNKRNIFWAFGIYIYTVSTVFYIIFRFEPRFFMALLPYYLILAGYGLCELQNKIKNKYLSEALLIFLIVPMIFSFRLSALAFKNDTRVLLRNWAQKNLPQKTKILVNARLTRFPTTKEAVSEQQKIDPTSVRKIDKAEAELNYSNLHSLNIFDANNKLFFENIDKYIKENKYEYAAISPGYRHSEFFENVLKKGILLKSFSGGKSEMSIAESQFFKNPFELFKIKELGPEIKLYKIN